PVARGLGRTGNGFLVAAGLLHHARNLPVGLDLGRDLAVIVGEVVRTPGGLDHPVEQPLLVVATALGFEAAGLVGRGNHGFYSFTRSCCSFPATGTKSSGAPGGIGGCVFRLCWKAWIMRRIGVRTQLASVPMSVSSLGSRVRLNSSGDSRWFAPALGSASHTMCIFQSRHLAARSSCLM